MINKINNRTRINKEPHTFPHTCVRITKKKKKRMTTNLVMQRHAGVRPNALLSGTKSPEILSSFGDDIIVQFNNNPPFQFISDAYVQKAANSPAHGCCPALTEFLCVCVCLYVYGSRRTVWRVERETNKNK